MLHTPVSELVKKLDRIFSLFVRLLSAGPGGYVACYTCGKQAHFTEMEAGHFIGRSAYAVRFDVRNVKPQCKYCNKVLEGNTKIFEQRLELEYGASVVSELKQLKHKVMHFASSYLTAEISRYKTLVEHLASRM